MSGITALQPVSMGLLFHSRTDEDILNDLWVEWVKMALEFELESIVRHRFPGHSQVARNRLERWNDELGFFGLKVQFRAERLWREITSWFAAGAFKAWLNPPRRPHLRHWKVFFRIRPPEFFRSQYFWAQV
jgi:hypothetical protein